MKSRTSICVTVMILFAAVTAPGWPAARDQPGNEPHIIYTILNLGTLGGTSSSGNSINTLGWATGSSNLSGNTTMHATLWSHGSTLDLGTLGGPNSATLWPVHNNRGIIAGVSDTSSMDPLGESWSCGAFFLPSHTGHSCLGFVWRNGVMKPLPTLGGNNGFATGVNNRGQVVGWAESAVHDPTCVPPQVLQFEAVIYGPNGNVRELPPFSGDPDGAATAINDQGEVVGISGICQNAVGNLSAEHAVLWANGVPMNIGNLGGAGWNTPMAINERGEIVGFSDLTGDNNGQTPNFHAFLWTSQKGIQDLGTLPGDVLSEALGINDEGQVVGVSIDANNNERAFIWQNGVMTDLNTLVGSGTSLYLLAAGDINDRGEITGQGYIQSTGDTPAFLAVPGFDRNARGLTLPTVQVNGIARRATLPEAVRNQLLQRLGVGRLRTGRH